MSYTVVKNVFFTVVEVLLYGEVQMFSWCQISQKNWGFFPFVLYLSYSNSLK